MTQSTPRPPRFCGQCGAELIPGGQFCIECGQAVSNAVDMPSIPIPAATGVTVRLANAVSAQQVLGTTTKLVTDAAIPPGMWHAPEPPGAQDTIAVYVPLRAVVAGWSGTLADGWSYDGQSWAADGTSRELVRFSIQRTWFPAPGAARDLHLIIQISASSFAEEGRTRRGFTYRAEHDPPMEVLDAWWDAPGEMGRRNLPTPQIQLMAPPRVQRVSDYDELIERAPAPRAHQLVQGSATNGLYLIQNLKQQRTPAGRGIVLYEASVFARFGALIGGTQQFYRLNTRNPLVVDRTKWDQVLEQIHSDAVGYGLDMETDAVIEWWLERAGHDAAVFERWNVPGGGIGRLLVAFRRRQIIAVE